MNLLEQLSKKAFWDVDMSTMDEEKHANYIIEKVFEHGSLKDIRSVMRHYDREQIAVALLKSNFLYPDTLHFASVILDIPKERFRCYTKTLSLPNVGIYSKS